MNDTRTAYLAASTFFVDVAAAVPPDTYGDPSLPGWSTLHLLAHGNRSHLLVVEYLERPVDVATLPAGYFSNANIDRRAAAAVQDLGADPMAKVREAATAARELVRTVATDTMMGTPFGPLAFDAYLPSRTAELVLHGLDLAAVAGVECSVPPQAEAAAALFLAERAVAKGLGGVLLSALSGRAGLPERFNVY